MSIVPLVRLNSRLATVSSNNRVNRITGRMMNISQSG
jgi:hypothetical protein